ncbi:MAG: DUF547 domain-containing protein [Gammaproteobacteria bacterium]|nr:DUF547 domain-containing protein [Gammaproteobacteria bacterium]
MIHARVLVATFALAISFLGTVTLAAPKSELIPYWDASDESNSASIDHSEWQQLLDKYLREHPSGINRFDYGALKEEREDYELLIDYLLRLSDLDPRSYSRSEQLPFWINFYNALTVYVVTGRFPVKSIKDIKSGTFDSGPWNLKLATIQDQELTLNNIEHGILRPIWKDSRIHYALNCASLGCPNLATKAYRSDNTEELLEAGAREYINHPRGVLIKNNRLTVSSIYEWYRDEFENSDEGVLSHLSRYAKPELAEQLKKFKKYKHTYDWKLNAP